MPKRGIKVKVSLEGKEELLAALKQMASAIKKQVMEEAVREGGAVILERAKALAPGPYIAMEISQLTERYAEVSIGPDDDHWYYRLFETGAAEHEIKGAPLAFINQRGRLLLTKSVSHPGMEARPWLRPAADEEQERAKSVLGDFLRKKLKP